MYNSDSYVFVGHFSDCVGSYFLSNNLSWFDFLNFRVFLNNLLNNSLENNIFLNDLVIGGRGDDILRNNFSDGSEGLAFNDMLRNWALSNDLDIISFLVGDSNNSVVFSFALLDNHDSVNVVAGCLGGGGDNLGCGGESARGGKFADNVLDNCVFGDDGLVVSDFDFRSSHRVNFV